MPIFFHINSVDSCMSGENNDYVYKCGKIGPSRTIEELLKYVL